MSAPAAKKDTFPLLRDLAVFAGALGFFAYSLRALPPPPPVVAPATFSAASRLLASRVPASIATGAYAPPAESNVGQYELPCAASLGTPRATTTNARIFRLRAPHCAIGAVTAHNETTGESVMVFVNGEGWVTSYFPLAEGANELVIEWREKGKARAQKLRITRSSAST